MFAMVLHGVMPLMILICVYFNPIQPILDPARKADTLIDALALIRNQNHVSFRQRAIEYRADAAAPIADRERRDADPSRDKIAIPADAIYCARDRAAGGWI